MFLNYEEEYFLNCRAKKVQSKTSKYSEQDGFQSNFVQKRSFNLFRPSPQYVVYPISNYMFIHSTLLFKNSTFNGRVIVLSPLKVGGFETE